MIKRAFGVSVIAMLLTLGIPAIASAHVLKVDGNIGAVLHINPDDNPTTDGNTDYIMSFNDDSGRFSLPKCDCSVSFIINGKTLASNRLIDSSDTVSENHYTFPTAGVYDVRFTGSPKTAGAFQTFTLDYEVRVTNGQVNTQPMPVTLWVGMGMMIGLVLLAAFAMDYDTNETANEE